MLRQERDGGRAEVGEGPEAGGYTWPGKGGLSQRWRAQLRLHRQRDAREAEGGWALGRVLGLCVWLEQKRWAR